MTQDTLNTMIFISPLIAGGIIAAINGESINDATEKAESWARRTQSNVSSKTGWFYGYIINPILWLIVKFSDWTDSFSHRGLKNGARVAAALYLIAAWCLILYLAVMAAVMLVITGVIIYILFQILINSNEDVKKSYEKGRRIIGSTGAGNRINQDTGVIQKEGLFGYNDTDQRIDPKTGKVQKEGIFGWNDSDTKIDQETGIIQKEGLFGYNDTDTRIHPETGVIQQRGTFGWQDTDERISPETGRRQKQGLLGWADA